MRRLLSPLVVLVLLVAVGALGNHYRTTSPKPLPPPAPPFSPGVVWSPLKTKCGQDTLEPGVRYSVLQVNTAKQLWIEEANNDSLLVFIVAAPDSQRRIVFIPASQVLIFPAEDAQVTLTKMKIGRYLYRWQLLPLPVRAPMDSVLQDTILPFTRGATHFI